jgi:uncharacterized membrane protein
MRRSIVWALGVLLATSLLGNVFLGGVLLGERLFAQQHGTRALVERFLESVPEEARPEVRRQLRARRGAIVKHVLAVAEARRAVADTLARPEARRGEVDAAFEQLRARTQAAQTAAHDAIAQVMLDLPADVRARWAERWQPARRWRGSDF